MQSPGWQPTLRVAWCLTWWFASLGKCGHIWHRMLLLRPGAIKQHKTKPNPLLVPCQWKDSRVHADTEMYMPYFSENEEFWSHKGIPFPNFKGWMFFLIVRDLSLDSHFKQTEEMCLAQLFSLFINHPMWRFYITKSIKCNRLISQRFHRDDQHKEHFIFSGVTRITHKTQCVHFPGPFFFEGWGESLAPLSPSPNTHTKQNVHTHLQNPGYATDFQDPACSSI